MNNERELLERLIQHLHETRILADPAVGAALGRIPRHLFVPEVSSQEAYEDRAIAILERDGLVLSSISQPSMIVQMLQLLDVHPGMRILEIGSGSGYNAALLAELAGTNGSVLSVDIEPELLERAAAALALLHLNAVRVAHASALQTETRPFDRIIVTARADDIDKCWWELLRDRGRIVLPLDIGYGGERAIGLLREGNYLRSIGSHACAFLEMRTRSARIASEIFFRNRGERFALAPHARDPVDIVAVRREDAEPSLLAGVDAVVARPHTLFGIRR